MYICTVTHCQCSMYGAWRVGGSVLAGLHKQQCQTPSIEKVVWRVGGQPSVYGEPVRVLLMALRQAAEPNLPRSRPRQGL